MNEQISKIEENLLNYKEQLENLKVKQNNLLSGISQKVGLFARLQNLVRKK